MDGGDIIHAWFVGIHDVLTSGSLVGELHADA